MITNLQTYFQKHYRWMFAFLLVVIVIPFVFAYSPGSKISDVAGDRSAGAKLFFGHNLNDKNEVQQLAKDTAIGSWLKTGYPPYDPTELQTMALSRLVELDLVEKLGIPSPSSDQLASYISSLPAFRDTSGRFSQKKFKELEERFVKEEGLSKDYLTERIVERWRLDQLTDRLEGVSYCLPSTVDREYKLLNTKYSVQVAVYKGVPDATLTISDEEAKKYFEANKTRYHTEETRDGIVYKLPAEKFLAQAPAPTEEQLQKFFDQISFRFLQWQVKDESGKVTGAEPKAPVLAEHREETIKLYKQFKASRAAAEAVDVIVQKIYADKISPNSKAWDELIKASGLEAQEVKALAKTSTALDEESVGILFTRTSAQPYSEAFQTEIDGRFVLLTATQTSKPLAYEAVTEKVKTDALEAKKQKTLNDALVAKIDELKKAVTTSSFAEASIKGGFVLSSPEPFTLSKPEPLINSGEVLNGLLKAGKGALLSDINGAEAIVVVLNDRQVPTPDAKTADYKKLQTQIENVYRSLGAFAYLNEWAELHGQSGS